MESGGLRFKEPSSELSIKINKELNSLFNTTVPPSFLSYFELVPDLSTKGNVQVYFLKANLKKEVLIEKLSSEFGKIEGGFVLFDDATGLLFIVPYSSFKSEARKLLLKAKELKGQSQKDFFDFYIQFRNSFSQKILFDHLKTFVASLEKNKDLELFTDSFLGCHHYFNNLWDNTLKKYNEIMKSNSQKETSEIFSKSQEDFSNLSSYSLALFYLNQYLLTFNQNSMILSELASNVETLSSKTAKKEIMEKINSVKKEMSDFFTSRLSIISASDYDLNSLNHTNLLLVTKARLFLEKISQLSDTASKCSFFESNMESLDGFLSIMQETFKKSGMDGAASTLFPLISGIPLETFRNLLLDYDSEFVEKNLDSAIKAKDILSIILLRPEDFNSSYRVEAKKNLESAVDVLKSFTQTALESNSAKKWFKEKLESLTENVAKLDINSENGFTNARKEYFSILSAFVSSVQYESSIKVLKEKYPIMEKYQKYSSASQKELSQIILEATSQMCEKEISIPLKSLEYDPSILNHAFNAEPNKLQSLAYALRLLEGFESINWTDITRQYPEIYAFGTPRGNLAYAYALKEAYSILNSQVSSAEKELIIARIISAYKFVLDFYELSESNLKEISTIKDQISFLGNILETDRPITKNEVIQLKKTYLDMLSGLNERYEFLKTKEYLENETKNATGFWKAFPYTLGLLHEYDTEITATLLAIGLLTAGTGALAGQGAKEAGKKMAFKEIIKAAIKNANRGGLKRLAASMSEKGILGTANAITELGFTSLRPVIDYGALKGTVGLLYNTKQYLQYEDSDYQKMEQYLSKMRDDMHQIVLGRMWGSGPIKYISLSIFPAFAYSFPAYTEGQGLGKISDATLLLLSFTPYVKFSRNVFGEFSKLTALSVSGKMSSIVSTKSLLRTSDASYYNELKNYVTNENIPIEVADKLNVGLNSYDISSAKTKKEFSEMLGTIKKGLKESFGTEKDPLIYLRELSKMKTIPVLNYSNKNIK